MMYAHVTTYITVILLRTLCGRQKNDNTVAMYLLLDVSYSIRVTYFLHTKCNRSGVTNVKKPMNEHRPMMTGSPPSMDDICLINIGCASRPPILVVNDTICNVNKDKIKLHSQIDTIS